MLIGKNLIYPTDFTVEQLEKLFQLTDDIIAKPEKYARSCVGKILATMFLLSWKAGGDKKDASAENTATSCSNSAENR